MKTHSTKASSTSTRKPALGKQVASALAICPTDGAGWCPYPFSPAQLAKRLKTKTTASAEHALKSSPGRKIQVKER